MIKGNESLVENFNYNFLTSLSGCLKMLRFDANTITIRYLVTGYEEFVNAKNINKQRNLNTVFANIAKTLSDIRLIPLDHVSLSLTVPLSEA